jgi:hypothetical protein
VQKGVVLKYSRKTTKLRGLSANFCLVVFLPSGKQLGGGLVVARSLLGDACRRRPPGRGDKLPDALPFSLTSPFFSSSLPLFPPVRACNCHHCCRFTPPIQAAPSPSEHAGSFASTLSSSWSKESTVGALKRRRQDHLPCSRPELRRPDSLPPDPFATAESGIKLRVSLRVSSPFLPPLGILAPPLVLAGRRAVRAGEHLLPRTRPPWLGHAWPVFPSEALFGTRVLMGIIPKGIG